MDDFESFTREQISRLRLEADALEKALKAFQASKARLTGAARRSGGDQPRSGAFGVIMEAISKAGPKGLTLDEMIAAAAAEGYEVKRGTLRSQIWQAKNDGEVLPLEAGRYRNPIGDAELTHGAMNYDEAPTPERAARDEGGYSGGFSSGPRTHQPAPPAPREEFSADLDDEIPF
jgi:hypothetical protein